MKPAPLAVLALSSSLTLACDTHGVDLGQDAYVRLIDLDALPQDAAPEPDAARADAFLQVLDSGPPLVFLDQSVEPPLPDGDVGPPCIPTVEVCNGKDDNCDDRIDEGTLIGTTCWPRRGECLLESPRMCDEAGAPVCTVPEEATCRADPLVFAMISDYGESNSGSVLADLVRGFAPAFIVTAGDNNFPAGEAETMDRNVGQFYASFIGNYRGAFGDGAEDNRFWPALGHLDWMPEGAQPYLDFFTLPGNERYYDVDLGVVHLFVLDSDEREPDGNTWDSVQGQWFQQAVAASRACFKLAVFHHPPYSSAARGDNNGGVPMRWPFAAAGIDAVVTGHDRFYERLLVDGIPHFVVGWGGGGDNHNYADPPRPESQFRYRDRFGALRVTVNATDVTFDFFNIVGQKIDTLVRPLRCPQ